MVSKTEIRLKYNTVLALLHQIVAVVCGFVIPRTILGAYGSEVNGLVNSVAQFLHVIAFLELGVGAVVQSALYKPLANQDMKQTSKVIASAERFFRTIAYVLVFYTVFLVLFYNKLNASDFDWAYTATLILAMSISFFAQYYFGIVDRLLLTADQRGYIQYAAQIATLLLNVIACVVLIWLGASIQIVKLVSSLVFLARPLFLRIYINRKYILDRRIKYEGEPIAQKWNGIAQHIAYTVMDSTDIIVLTLLSTLENVSIYSVYHLVVYGVKQLFMSLADGIQPVLGEYYATKDMERLKAFFSKTEWLLHTGVVLFFGCTGSLIIPFVMTYTKGINDVNYVQPLFAVLIVLAHATHCLRMPYNMLIFASGHFKQTQNCYFAAAFINIAISVITVDMWGLIGVAIGTLSSMAFQTVWMAWYNSRNILKRSLKYFWKQAFVDAVTLYFMWMGPIRFEIVEISYISWFLLAVECFIAYVAFIAVINMVFYRDHMLFFIRKILKKRAC